MPTKIEWTDETWNPITGCTPVSEGCANCYARRMATRLAGRCGYPRFEPFNVVLHDDRLHRPSTWKKKRRVFVCSMGDLFHPAVPLEYVFRVFHEMGSNPEHVFQVLTKRPERAMLFSTGCQSRFWQETKDELNGFPWPPPNVWMGVSVEKQRYARERLPILCETPAAERFISCEPLLGPLNLTPWLDAISWVIVGAETGPGARPMDPQWALSIRDQCRRHGVRFFFKKDSDGNRELDGQLCEEYPG